MLVVVNDHMTNHEEGTCCDWMQKERRLSAPSWQNPSLRIQLSVSYSVKIDFHNDVGDNLRVVSVGVPVRTDHKGSFCLFVWLGALE